MNTIATTAIDEFLDAVDALRENDEAVRTTAHTSSVAAEDWLPSDNATS